MKMFQMLWIFNYHHKSVLLPHSYEYTNSVVIVWY